MGSDMHHSVRDWKDRQLSALRKSGGEFIELWDAWEHPECSDTFADVEDAFRAKIEAIRAALNLRIF